MKTLPANSKYPNESTKEFIKRTGKGGTGAKGKTGKPKSRGNPFARAIPKAVGGPAR